MTVVPKILGPDFGFPFSFPFLDSQNKTQRRSRAWQTLANF